MPIEKSEKESLLLRTILIFTMILFAAALRLAPHPWNFTPVGAIALFSGAMVRDRRLAFLFPLLVMFATDAIIGFNKLSPLVYASFLLSVLIGHFLNQKRNLLRIAGATFLGSLQFFLITNFGVWAFLGSYPRTSAGLAACYSPVCRSSGTRSQVTPSTPPCSSVHFSWQSVSRRVCVYTLRRTSEK